MTKKILPFASLFILSLPTFAQNAFKTYAITNDGSTGYNWVNIKQIDISTGKIAQEIYQQNKTPYSLIDATTKMPASATQSIKFNTTNGTSNVVQIPDAPTATMVAATAYDQQHNKLFFTPMNIGELRWIDFSNTKNGIKFYAQKTQLLTTLDLSDEANHITRMDIAADGNGYAITNDANHLIRFTTGNKTVITDLGNLVDAETNKGGISIHNKCTSWGGDMVADAFGKLYVITANHQLFKIDVDTRIATHLGTITGLPANFTTNGAAVDDNGSIVVSSAVTFDGLYKFTLNNLAAIKIEGSDKTYNASDLANANLLLQKEYDAQKSLGLATIITTPTLSSKADTKIYPNPVTENQFKILFTGQQTGQYNVSITDLSGRVMMSNIVFVSTKLQNVPIQITNTITKGIYFVKVTNAANQTAFIEKIMVQ